MKRLVAWTFCSVLTVGSAFGQPYGWIPGSSADAPSETGNRMVVVDLGAEAVVGGVQFADGFLFTTEPGGADPLVPTFSPDGSLVYVLVGGDADKLALSPPEPPHGHMYVFNTADVIAKLKAGTEPGPADALQAIEIRVPEEDGTNTGYRDDPLEPVGQAITPDGTKLVMTEAGYDRFYIWDLDQDGLFQTASDSEGTFMAPAGETILPDYDDPSPPMILNDGSKAYFTTQLVEQGSKTAQATPPMVVSVNMSTESEIAKIAVPPPDQGTSIQGINTIPYASVSFEQSGGANYTAFDLAGTPHADDSTLYIYSGYIGFSGTVEITDPFPISVPFSLSDPFRIYTLDTAADTLDSGPGENGSLYDENGIPGSAEPIFAPLASVFGNSSGEEDIHAGSAVYIPFSGPIQAWVPDNSDLMLSFGVRASNGIWFVGSLQEIDGNAVITSGGLRLKDGPSTLYMYDPSAKIAQTTLGAVHAIDRSLTFPLGFVGDKLMFGSTDNLFLLPVGEDADATTDTDTILAFADISGTGQVNELPLQIAAGAYAQQPESSYNGDAVGDFNGDKCTNLSDFLILLDGWQDPYTLNDFLALLDNWQQGEGCAQPQ